MSSWLKFKPHNPLGNNQSIFIENLKITTRQISFSKSNGNIMNIGLYSNIDKYVLDQTESKEIILSGEGSTCSKEYYKIFNKKTLLSVELEDNSLKYQLQFNNKDNLRLVNQAGAIFAYGNNIDNKLIDLIVKVEIFSAMPIAASYSLTLILVVGQLISKRPIPNLPFIGLLVIKLCPNI